MSPYIITFLSKTFSSQALALPQVTNKNCVALPPTPSCLTLSNDALIAIVVPTELSN